MDPSDFKDRGEREFKMKCTRVRNIKIKMIKPFFFFT